MIAILTVSAGLLAYWLLMYFFVIRPLEEDESRLVRAPAEHDDEIRFP